MAENSNEENDLKSSSSIESNETFEEKMARIQAILNGQKNEVAARRDGIVAKEAPSLTPELAETANEGTNSELVAKSELSGSVPVDISESSETRLTSSTSVEVTSNFLTSNQMEVKSELEAKIKAEEITPLEAAILPEPEKLPTNETEQEQAKKVTTATKTAKKKSRIPIVLGVLAVLLLAFALIFYFQQKAKDNNSKANQSSLSSKSEESSSSSESSQQSSSIESSTESSSTSQSSTVSNSTSAVTPAPQSRAEIIASVGPSPKSPLDPNITGQESAFNWPPGLQSQVVAQAQAAGRIGQTGYKFIPASIAGDQGWMNLYDANGQFVLAVNLTTNYILQ